MQLHPPPNKPRPMPPPQLSSQPQPQFVAAKSLMNRSSKNLDYTYILCSRKKRVQQDQGEEREENI